MPIATIAQSAADRMAGSVTRRPTFTTHLGAVDRMAMGTRVASVGAFPDVVKDALRRSDARVAESRPSRWGDGIKATIDEVGPKTGGGLLQPVPVWSSAEQAAYVGANPDFRASPYVTVPNGPVKHWIDDGRRRRTGPDLLREAQGKGYNELRGIDSLSSISVPVLAGVALLGYFLLKK